MRLWLELQQSREQVARRTRKTCSSTPLAGSPARRSQRGRVPSLPLAPDLWQPAKPQGKVPQRYLKGCDLWRGSSPVTSSTVASVFASFSPSHGSRFLSSPPVFTSFALLSFPSLVVFLPPLSRVSAHHAPHTGWKQQATRYGLISHD